jgi:type I pantothenate kinase
VQVDLPDEVVIGEPLIIDVIFQAYDSCSAAGTVDLIVDGETVSVQQPDILIIEGLNVLQVGSEANEFVSDYFDFSIYIDAEEPDIEQWYIERFQKLRETVFRDPDSFFQNFAHLTDEEGIDIARGIWREINGKNLVDNIEPTKSRASLIVAKGADHRVTDVHLRRL